MAYRMLQQLHTPKVTVENVLMVQLNQRTSPDILNVNEMTTSF
jgi:hypothetical protein